MATTKSFDDLNLKMNLLRGIYGYGFEHPSRIQEQSIPKLLTGRDLIAQAASGQGKTASFGISALELVDEQNPKTQVLILSPTRELTQQSHYILQQLGKYMKLKIGLCIGGTSIKECIQENKDAQIIVATSGRLLDLLKRRKIKLESLKLFIIDEADELLSKGFIDNFKYLLNTFIPSNAQIGLFSATYPEDLENYTDNFLNNPEIIRVKPQELTLEGLKQYFVDVRYEEHKFSTLCDLYNSIQIYQSIIYTHSKQQVEILYDKLCNQNFTVSMIHGKMSQVERNKIMQSFRKGETRILLSTDLLARGIDVQQVSLVINYELPKYKENFMHRCGRAGRFGRKGTVINLISKNEYQLMDEIQKFYNIQIDELPASFKIEK